MLASNLSAQARRSLIGQPSRQGDDFLIHRQRRSILVAHVLQRLNRQLYESIRIAGDVGTLVGLAVIHPVQVATGALRHGADRNAPFGFQVFGQAVGKEAEVIRRPTTTMVMHREVGQHPEWLALRGLNGDHRELIINWSGWPDVVLVLVARVHHGPDGPVAEGIELHAVRSGNPATAMREPGCPDLGPSDAGGFQLGVSLPDALGNLSWKKLGVGGVGHGPETEIHDARGTVRVGRGNKDAVGRNACGFRGQLLCFIANGAWDHAAVDDGDRDTHLTPLENEAPGLEIPGVHLPALALGEPSADYVRVEGTGHVLNVSPGPKRLLGLNGWSSKA